MEIIILDTIRSVYAVTYFRVDPTISYIDADVVVYLPGWREIYSAFIVQYYISGKYRNAGYTSYLQDSVMAVEKSLNRYFLTFLS